MLPVIWWNCCEIYIYILGGYQATTDNQSTTQFNHSMGFVYHPSAFTKVWHSLNDWSILFPLFPLMNRWIYIYICTVCTSIAFCWSTMFTIVSANFSFFCTPLSIAALPKDPTAPQFTVPMAQGPTHLTASPYSPYRFKHSIIFRIFNVSVSAPAL